MVVGGRSSFQADYGLFDWNVDFAAEESRLKVIRVERQGFSAVLIGVDTASMSVVLVVV